MVSQDRHGNSIDMVRATTNLPCKDSDPAVFSWY